MTGAQSGGHRFQSFWHGECLSPYELFCLKSFIDCGHAVDLYTYHPDLGVPAGVRVCNAGELLNRDEVFVYQAEGFGKGSPSAFSNLFRYKLLAEKGGWWIDTDVVCLTGHIPTVSEFFARQDEDLIACGTIYFEARHPVMMRCLEQTMELGRTVKWGDAGPRLFTRVLKECGLIDRAHPASVCYPVHYTQALDMLRQSRTAALSRRIESSLFLHLYNSTLEFHGVRKMCRPPKGSLLRACADKHPVDGWTGEYDEQTLEKILNFQAAMQVRATQTEVHAAEMEVHIAENERLRAQLAAIHSSTIWRLTAPLRSGSRALSALRTFGKRQ
jgi:hypothetical protein